MTIEQAINQLKDRGSISTRLIRSCGSMVSIYIWLGQISINMSSINPSEIYANDYEEAK